MEANGPRWGEVASPEGELQPHALRRTLCVAPRSTTKMDAVRTSEMEARTTAPR